MPNLSNLPQAMDQGQGFNPIQKEDLAFEGEKLTDEAALKLVTQDAILAERFIQSKNLIAEWNGADDLFRCYVQTEKWPNSDKLKSALPMPVIMEAIRAVLPQCYMAFFSDPTPFLLEAKGKTSPLAAKAMGHLVCWAMEETNFRAECRKLLKSGLLYGQLVAKYGWEPSVHKERKYERDNDGSVSITQTERVVTRPSFEYVSLRNVLVTPDTNCQDIRTAKAVTFQKFITARDLDDLRKIDGYKNVPTRAQLKELLVEGSEPTEDSLRNQQQVTYRENQAEQTTNMSAINPLDQNLELLERWDQDRVITVLQRKIVIRNEEHTLPDGKPFLSCSFEEVLNSFYGFGMAKLLAGEQNLQQGALNKWVDSLSLKSNPMWKRKKGVGQQSQNIAVSTGKVVNEDELEVLEFPDISQEIMAAMEASAARAARRVGSNAGPDMPTQAMRTAEGVNAFTSGVQVQLQYFIEAFADLVFIPAIKAFIQLIKDNMEPDEILAILSDKDDKALANLDVMDVYNGKYSVDVLTSVKLAGRRAMAQLIPMIMQFLGQPGALQMLSQQGKKFDFAAFFEDVFSITGWPGDEYIQDMTAEDMARMQQNNPAVVKAQAAQQQAAQDQQNTLQQIEAKGDAQAGVAVVRKLLEGHIPNAQPLADQVTGQPGQPPQGA